MEYPTTRKEALQRNSIYYKTTKLCTRGHHEKRYAKNGRCVACDRQNNQKRRDGVKDRTPFWLTENHHKMIASLNETCNNMNKLVGARSYHVDHIIPLHGDTVSGLHVPWNLQISHGQTNLVKGNRVYERTELA